MKDEFAEVVGLKSKMYSMKKIDGKECNTAKGVSVATEFNEFNVLFNKKIMRQKKLRRIQAKNHKFGTYEIDNHYLFSMTKYVSKDGIHMLAYFHKDLKMFSKDSHI